MFPFIHWSWLIQAHDPEGKRMRVFWGEITLAIIDLLSKIRSRQAVV